MNYKRKRSKRQSRAKNTDQCYFRLGNSVSGRYTVLHFHGSAYKRNRLRPEDLE